LGLWRRLGAHRLPAMFLTQRRTPPEYFDALDRPLNELQAAYRQLGRVNRCFKFSHPFVWVLPRWLGRERCRRLEFLDLGAGDGLLGRILGRWAHQRGWDWQFTNLDINPRALALNPNGRNVVGSVLALPFEEGCFDVVIASQMTHHLNTEVEVVQHFREAWRVTREAVLLSDVHRNAGLMGLVWLGTLLLGCSRPLRADALVSVQRAFRVAEWKSLAHQAGLADARVWLYAGTRLMLQARKPAPTLSR